VTRALHPDLAAVGGMIRAAGIRLPQPGDGVPGARAYSDAVGALATRNSAPLADERTVVFDGPDGGVATKLYLPDAASSLASSPALMFYLHGGGFRLDGWDAALRGLVRASGLAALSVDYRLAPEHPFPAGLDDSLAVMRRVIADRAVAGVAFTRFAAGGDSAGANLALAAALVLRDAGVRALDHLLLFYGVYSTDLTTPSWLELGGAFGLSAAQMQAIWADYLGESRADWPKADGRIEPICADLSGLPPTRIVVGDLDPLLDENTALDARLRAAGVASSLAVLPDVNHGVIRFAEIAPLVGDLVQAEGEALAAAFDVTPRPAG